jgi:hypothetical protein
MAETAISGSVSGASRARPGGRAVRPFIAGYLGKGTSRAVLELILLGLVRISELREFRRKRN